MKGKKNVIIEGSKIFLNCLAFALCFIKIFHEVAVLPGIDGNGEQIISRFDYYYSVYDKFSRQNLLPFLGVTLALLIASSITSALSLAVKDKQKLKIASHIIFGTALTVFIAAMLVASMIWYCY